MTINKELTKGSMSLMILSVLSEQEMYGYQMIGEINRRSESEGGVRVDTLVAGIEEGRRSFKIHRKKPDGKSYARDIAERYGLSFDALKKR